jgi:hypothetical protein
MYRPVYNEEALRQILSLRPASLRLYVLKQIEIMADNPFAKGEFETVDSAGRKNQIKIFGTISITFWADHPVKELRVIDIRKLVR